MPSHPKQIANSCKNKPTLSVMKVKSKNKRRNRKKKKQKVQYPIHEMRKMSSVNSEYNATDAGDHFQQNQMAVAQMWAKTYETMIRLQYQHRIQYWKNLAMNQNAEIQKLKEKLQGNGMDKMDSEEEDEDEDEPSTKCSSQKINEESEESDESYLKFLEITLRHRQQRKRNRESEAKF